MLTSALPPLFFIVVLSVVQKASILSSS